MSKGNKPPKNDKANKKPKKAKAERPTPSKAHDDLNLDRLSGVFNTVNKKAGAL